MQLSTGQLLLYYFLHRSKSAIGSYVVRSGMQKAEPFHPIGSALLYCTTISIIFSLACTTHRVVYPAPEQVERGSIRSVRAGRIPVSI